MDQSKLSPTLWTTKDHVTIANLECEVDQPRYKLNKKNDRPKNNSQLPHQRWYELTIKSGQSRVNVSYSPPSPQTLIPYALQPRVTQMYRVKWK